MLNLLYYDMKATIKRSWCYFIILTLLAFIVRFLLSDAFISFFTDINFIYGIVIGVVAGGFLAAMGILVILIIIVYQTQWFDENILSAQGQLTNMLPVKSHQIILSKIITSLIWSILLGIMAIGVVCIVLVGTDYFKTLAESIVEIGLNNNVNINLPKFIILSGIYFITGVTSFICLCFLSQMIGQMSAYLKNTVVFFSFVFIMALSLFIEYKAAIFMGITLPASFEMNNILNFCIQAMTKLTIINVFMIVIYWILSSAILKNHLNVV